MSKSKGETTLAAANVKIEHDKSRNMSRYVEIIGEAASQGTDVLVLPEMGLQGYADFGLAGGSKAAAAQKQYFVREAETIPGPSTERIAAEARRHGMYIQLGLAESALGGNVIFNSTALIGPEGLVGVYRKVHNTFEFPYFAPGEETPVFKTCFGTVASIICYDLVFPELLRSLVLKGADIILMSNAWPMKGHDRENDYHGYTMDLAAKANCFFNQSWLVLSNHCETGVYSSGSDYYGGTQIVDPFGKVVAYLAMEEGLITHTANLSEEVLRSRTDGFFGFNLLQDRRPEHYGEVVSQRWRRAPAGVTKGAASAPATEAPSAVIESE